MTIVLSIIFVIGFAYIVSQKVSASSWEPVWHGTDWIQPSNVIKSKEMAENLQYLYDMVGVSRKYENCDFKLIEGIDCKVPYTCNCGKYGCSTCYADGKRTDLKIACPGKVPITFNGSCRDPRKEMTCGKYGCTCGTEGCTN